MGSATDFWTDKKVDQEIYKIVEEKSGKISNVHFRNKELYYFFFQSRNPVTPTPLFEASENMNIITKSDKVFLQMQISLWALQQNLQKLLYFWFPRILIFVHTGRGALKGGGGVGGWAVKMHSGGGEGNIHPWFLV